MLLTPPPAPLRIISSLALLLAIFCQTGWGMDHNRTIALVVTTPDDPFLNRLVRGAIAQADHHLIPLEVFGLTKKTDTDQQIRLVENLIAKRFGAIVIAPADPTRLVAPLKRAVEDGIVVVNIGAPLDPGELFKAGINIPFVGPDDFQGAKDLASYLAARLHHRGRVLIVDGPPGERRNELRHQGFLAGLGDSPDIEVVASVTGQWKTEEAFTTVRRELQRYNDIDAILCANDAMALGARQASKLYEHEKNVASVQITGYGNIKSFHSALGAGQFSATVEQHPELVGKTAIEIGWKVLTTKTISADRTTPVTLVSPESFGRTVFFLLSDSQSPFFRQLLDGVRGTAPLFGIELQVLDSHNDDAQQMGDLLKAIDLTPDLILLTPVNSDSLLPAIEIATAKAIPIITVDRRINDPSILCHIASDNVEGGKMAARYILSHLGEGRKILELEGIPGASVTRERGRGFNEIIDSQTRAQVTGREAALFDREEARRTTIHLLGEHGSFDAIFAHNDAMALGAIDAYRKTGLRRPPIIVGFDGIKPAREAIFRGLLDATIAQQPYSMGRQAILTCVRYFRGEKLPKFVPVDLNLIE